MAARGRTGQADIMPSAQRAGQPVSAFSPVHTDFAGLCPVPARFFGGGAWRALEILFPVA